MKPQFHMSSHLPLPFVYSEKAYSEVRVVVQTVYIRDKIQTGKHGIEKEVRP
jgi:hypothetical protein